MTWKRCGKYWFHCWHDNKEEGWDMRNLPGKADCKVGRQSFCHGIMCCRCGAMEYREVCI